VVGTGGKTHYGFRTIRANSQVRNKGTFGVLRLTLHPSSYDWRFVPEPGKTFTDSGHDTCHSLTRPVTSAWPGQERPGGCRLPPEFIHRSPIPPPGRQP